MYYSFIAITFIAAYIFVKDILYVGWANYMANRIAQREGKTWLIMSFNWSTVLFFIMIGRFAQKKMSSVKIKSFLYILIYFLFVTLVTLFSGNRLSVIVLLIYGFLGFTIYNKFRISKITILLLGLSIILLFMVLSYYGTLRGNVDAIAEGEVQEQVDEVSDQSGGTMKQLATTLLKSFGATENLNWVMENNSWNLLYGKTFVAGLLSPVIPRAVWPNKPYGGGPELKNMIYPGSYSRDNDSRSSLTPGLICESFMNFSWLGLFFVAPFYGILLVWMKHLEWKSDHSIFRKALYVNVVVGFCFLLLFGEFLGIFSRVLLTSIPLIILELSKKLRLKF